MRPITVVLAADDNFAMPLSVAALSVAVTLPKSEHLDVWILDMGIRPQNRQLVERTLALPNAAVHWVDSLWERVAELPNTWPNITRAGYGRLLIPEMLPQTVERVLYLDCDVMARRSVQELFAIDMGGNASMGVPDVQTPFVSSPGGSPWWFRRGRSVDEPNFNSGVLLMDLEIWRAERIGLEALRYLTDGRHEFGQDQEAINAVAGQRIGMLDPRWNVQHEITDPSYCSSLPYTDEQLAGLHDDAWIVHFSNAKKPWHHGYDNPWAHEWYALAAKTPFGNWKPSLRRDVTRRARRVPKWALGKVRAKFADAA